jgi:RNA polymerase sigma-70 factor (ECF subfamily)
VTGPPPEDEHDLVRRVLDGDRVAFRRLFDRFFPRLYRFAIARVGGDREAARDIVQQTFCRAIEGLDGYRGEAALYTWFCRICHRLVIDHYRARGQEVRHIVHIEDSPQFQAILDAMTGPELDRPDVEVWRRDVKRAVQATLDRLPEHYAAVLEWKYIEEASIAEIAERLAVGPKAAESLLTRARVAFRDAIGTALQADDMLRPPART